MNDSLNDSFIYFIRIAPEPRKENNFFMVIPGPDQPRPGLFVRTKFPPLLRFNLRFTLSTSRMRLKASTCAWKPSGIGQLKVNIFSNLVLW